MNFSTSFHGRGILNSGSGTKQKAVRVLQQNQISKKEIECTVDDLKEVRPTQVGVDEGVLREMLRLGLNGEDTIESFFIADDPEIRKAARRIKIERRMQQAQIPQEDSQEPAHVPTSAEHQMESSMIKILELLEDSRRSITGVRVASIKNELERQQKERAQREDIDKLIKDECERVQGVFESINSNWKLISKTDDILTLYEKTEDQKDECLELLEQKDIIIANLKSRLKQADRQFNDELSKQDDYLRILTERINDQISVTSDCYRRELQQLQNTVNVEKTEVLDERRKQWEKMAGAKEHLELENMVKRYDYMQEYEEQIDSMAIEQHETMRDQKFIMETKLNKLTVEENRYRSAVMISKELLNYNVQVLQKRQDENRVIKGQQKRIVNRLQDSVRKMRSEQKNEIQRLEKMMKQLQEGIKNLHANVNTLNLRLKTLATSNNKKYFQLWDFNQGVAEDLIDKLIKADKKFHSSLLCVSWHVPSVEFSRNTMPSYNEAKALLKEMKGKYLIKNPLPNIEKRDMQKLFSLVLNSIDTKTEFLIDDTLKIFLKPLSPTSRTLITINSLFNALGMREKDDIEHMSKFFLPYVRCTFCENTGQDENSNGESPEVAQESQPTPEILFDRLRKQFAVTNVVIKEEFCSRGAILNLVTGDDELVIRENDPREEKILRKHEILGTEVDPTLLPILSTKSPSKICEPDPEEYKQENAAGRLRLLESIMCNKPGHHPTINPNHVSKALNEFVTRLSEERKSQELVSLKEILTQKTLTPSRLLTKKDVENFWKGFGKVFSEKKKLMWKSLLTQMKVNYKLLLKRHNLNDTLKKYSRKNDELKKLLSMHFEVIKPEQRNILHLLLFPCDETEDSISDIAEGSQL